MDRYQIVAIHKLQEIKKKKSAESRKQKEWDVVTQRKRKTFLRIRKEK